jgi:hypothetical protein
MYEWGLADVGEPLKHAFRTHVVEQQFMLAVAERNGLRSSGGEARGRGIRPQPRLQVVEKHRITAGQGQHGLIVVSHRLRHME